MDKQEATAILAEQLNSHRAQSYADLVAVIGQAENIEVSGPSGQRYQIEINVLWDDKPGGNVRVLASIDDGSASWVFAPLTDDFIKAPDGTFVDED